MPVSHLTNSVAEMLAAALNTVTEGSYSHLTTSEAEMLALLVSEMTGQSYSHLTTSVETLWELLLTQAAVDEIEFDRNTQSNEEIMAIIANGVTAPGGSYEGPLDIVSGAVVAYGQRALSAAMLGQPLYTIREDDGDTTQTFSSDAETGDAPTAAITAFLDGANGAVTSWKDQSGNDLHGTQASSGNQPAWLGSQYGDVPALSFTKASSQHLVTPQATINGAVTIFAVVTPTDSGGGANIAIAGANFEVNDGDLANWVLRLTGLNAIYAFLADANFDHAAGGYTANGVVSFAAPILLEVACEYGTLSIKVNGGADIAISENFNTAGALGAIAWAIAIGADDAAAPDAFWSGAMGELIIYDSILSDPNRLAIRQNVAAYHGITLP